MSCLPGILSCGFVIDCDGGDAAFELNEFVNGDLRDCLFACV